MKSYIIGIAGKKCSGKDTVASMINYIFAVGITKANYADWITNGNKYIYKYDRIIHFADSLKDCLSIIYNIPRNFLDDRIYKDDLWYCIETGLFSPDSTIKNNADKCYIINHEELKKYITLKNIIISTPNKHHMIKIRTLMQYFGTDICRRYLSNNIWVDSTIAKAQDIAEGKRLCIIPDVRYENEAAAIQCNDELLYGGVIVVRRNINDITEHDSENINVIGDFAINNDGTIINLFYKVYEICNQIIK